MKTPTPVAPAIRSRLAALMGIVVISSLAGRASAATDIYIRFDGIEGEETGRFEGWSRLVDATGDLHAPTLSAPELPEVRVSKRIDKTSPLLLKALGDGSVLPRVTLAWIDAGVVYYRISLGRVRVTSYSTSGDSDALPTEQLSFNYQKIEWSCIATGGPTGGLTATFDLPTQEAVLKIRRPFRANIETREGERGVRLTCPVEAGHRYRISGNGALDERWEMLEEFVAPEDGTLERFIPMEFPGLFLRVEALD